MRSRIALIIMLGVSLVFGLLFARQMYLSRNLPREQFDQKRLRILTYSTFMSPTGPGNPLIAAFKKRHGCEVQVQVTNDAGLMLEHLRLTQAHVPFDVVIGLDQILLADARNKSEWREIKVDQGRWYPAVVQAAEDPKFVAFDWSPMTFIYRADVTKPPESFVSLSDDKWRDKIALQDPRASSPGMQFLSWVVSLNGDKTFDFLQTIKPNVASVSPSWAFSYGLFKKKQAELVFSYLTSLAFHWGFENDHSYQAVNLPEGHPVQVEFAGVPASCKECELGEAFVREMLEPDAQKIIMEKNFMFPVLQEVAKGTVFAELPVLKTRLANVPSQGDLGEWDKVFK